MDRPPRPDFEWARLNDSELPLDELQRIDDAASRPTDEQGGAAGDAVAQPGMGLEITPPGLRAIWGQITDPYTAEGTPPALYLFEQITHDANAPAAVEGGLTGVALEVSGNVGVPAGTVCLFWPSEDALAGAAGEKWRFVAPTGGTGTVENYYSSTFNYYETTLVNISDTFTTTILVGAVWIVDGPGYFVVNAPYVQCGLLFWCWTTYAVTSAQLDDWTFPFTTTGGGVVIRMTASADFVITGIDLFPPYPLPDAAEDEAGIVFALANCSDHVMTVAHEGAASLAVNRFDLEDGLDQDVGPGGIVLFWYDTFTERIRSFRPSDPGATDELVKIDPTDTTPGFLADGVNGKLIAGTGILFTINNVGANETLTISATGAGQLAWVKFTKGFADFSVAAFTNTINLTTPAGVGTVLHAIKVKHGPNAFGGGGIAGYNISIGNSRLTNNRYLSTYSVFTAPSNTNLIISTLNQPDGLSHAGTDVITVTATSQTAFLNAATAGSVDIWLLLSTPP